MAERVRPGGHDDLGADTAPDAPRTQLSAGEETGAPEGIGQGERPGAAGAPNDTEPDLPDRASTREDLRERDTLSADAMLREGDAIETRTARPAEESGDGTDQRSWTGSTIDMTMRSMAHPGPPASGNWDERRVMRLEREVEQLLAAGRLLDKRLSRSELVTRVALALALSALLVGVLLEAR